MQTPLNLTKVISKSALYISATSFILVAVSAIATYFLITILNSGADVPAEYFAVNIIIGILPYLLVAVAALIIGVFTRQPQEVEEDSDTPPEESPSEEVEKAFDEDIA